MTLQKRHQRILTAVQMANRLNEDGVPTHRKGAKWHNKTVINILRNEKYCGDVLFQKTFSPGALCHCKQNRGELPQYLVRDAIPAIIDKKQWEITQLEYARRVKQFYGQPSPEQPFTGRIFCGVCGRTVVHSAFRTGGSFKTWWRCSTKVSHPQRFITSQNFSAINIFQISIRSIIPSF